MVTFVITRYKVENPVGCTISNMYSGKKCGELGTVALDVVSRRDGEPDQLYRNWRFCPADAELFVNGFLDAKDSKTEIIDR